MLNRISDSGVAGEFRGGTANSEPQNPSLLVGCLPVLRRSPPSCCRWLSAPGIISVLSPHDRSLLQSFCGDRWLPIYEGFFNTPSSAALRFSDYRPPPPSLLHSVSLFPRSVVAMAEHCICVSCKTDGFLPGAAD